MKPRHNLLRFVLMICLLMEMSLARHVGADAGSPGTPRTGATRSVVSASQATSRLFYLDLTGGRVLSAHTDGSDLKVLVRGQRGSPDGIAVDETAGHIFWTNMGVPSANDGFIARSNLDGTNTTIIVPAGATFTPKQLKLDEKNGKLYWSDREGMRVMRSNLNGSNIETLVETAQGEAARLNAANWCVGMALDIEGGKIYWTQKGGDNAHVGTIRRAGLEIPAGEDAAHRSDIEVLVAGLPEPIDLDLDLENRLMYWTDRGNPPDGNTVNRAAMDPPQGADPGHRTDHEILVRGLREGIGMALDLKGSTMYFTDVGGTVYSSNLDGSDVKTLLRGQGGLTGIAYVEFPK